MTSSLTSQRLDRAQIKANLDAFKLRWRERLDTWKDQKQGALEKKYAQSFWSDMFECFGIKAARMDLFEQDARRGSSGNTGYIDLFWPGMVIGEAKSPGVDLGIALEQARDYLQGGSVRDTEQPRYIICSDFENFRLVHLGAPDQRFDITFPLADVSDYVDQLKFLAGYSEVTHEEQEEASLQASKLMAALFTAMVGDEVDEEIGDEAPTNPEDEDAAVQETSMYLTRLLFLLFGDDAGLWEQDLFYRFVLDHTNSENLGSQLAALFNVLNTPENKRNKNLPDSLAAFPYVNGSIFAETLDMQYFNPAMRDALIDACRFQWTDISPAIFGSLFQLVKSKEARRSDGEHYTSEANILKTLNPLFLDEFREKAKTLIESKSGTKKQQLENIHAFHNELASHLFVDPACGSGNFLIVAYRELRKIETDIIVAIRERDGQDGLSFDVTWEQKLNIGQFHGIELNWWPARIAEVAMFLVDHQCNRELAARIGMAPERLPISVTAHIHHDNALHADWGTLFPQTPGQTFIFGNPPFSGSRTMSRQQKEDLESAWAPHAAGLLDFVTGWFIKAARLLKNRKGDFAFVATNSIVQGVQVPLLFSPLRELNWHIKFAHRTFVWDSESPGKAAVHCVIIGFTRDIDSRRYLWEYPNGKGDPVAIPVTRQINGYLVDGPWIVVGSRKTQLSPELPPVTNGSEPREGGNLMVTEEQVEDVKADPILRKYLRPFVAGAELVRGTKRWCLWLVDLDPSDIQKSAELRHRLDAVREMRNVAKQAATHKAKDWPHLFVQIRQPQSDYLCIPIVVSTNRRYYTVDYLSSEIICSNRVYAVEDNTGYLFALASSSMFITWQRAIGGQLKSDLSFSGTLTWNTFPLPSLTDEQRDRIIAAGKKVLKARTLHPDRSLAQHYNPLTMDPALVKAHDALDKEVDKAFGASRKLTTERQRQELLFANYARMTRATQQL